MNKEDDSEKPELRAALDHLLEGAKRMFLQALEAMPSDERMALDAALDSQRASVAVTMILPTGAIRVGVVGQWANERTLWEMTPATNVLSRSLNG